MFKLLVILSLVTSFSVFAQLVPASSSTGNVESSISDSEFQKLSNGAVPFCIKLKSKVIKWNKAYADKGLGKTDCSMTANAKREQAALGYTVVAVQIRQLSPTTAKQVMGK